MIVHVRVDRHGTGSLSPLTEKGKVDFMKKTMIIFLSIMMALAAAGCDGRQGRASGAAGGRIGNVLPVEKMEFMPVMAEEGPEPVPEPEVEVPGISQGKGLGREESQYQGREEGQCQEEEPYQEVRPAQEGRPALAEAEPLDAPAQESGPAGSGSCPGSGGDAAGSQQENNGGDDAAETASVAYNPQEVVSLVTAKVKAGGKLILSEELDRKLSEGAITQEEYQEYYPYDGTGYYSVFVETDLNRASTTSGRTLGSVDGIAQYLADMLLLEAVPSVGIEYAGVYTLNGSQFYEFRCHR